MDLGPIAVPVQDPSTSLPAIKRKFEQNKQNYTKNLKISIRKAYLPK